MTFDKVPPLGRRGHEGNFRDYPGNFSHHRPDPAYDQPPPWIGGGRPPPPHWMQRTPAITPRNPGERWYGDRIFRFRILSFHTHFSFLIPLCVSVCMALLWRLLCGLMGLWGKCLDVNMFIKFLSCFFCKFSVSCFCSVSHVNKKKKKV